MTEIKIDYPQLKKEMNCVVKEMQKYYKSFPFDPAINSREEAILSLRFGLGSDNAKSHSLEDVGAEFGVTAERIRMVEARALDKIAIYFRWSENNENLEKANKKFPNLMKII